MISARLYSSASAGYPAPITEGESFDLATYLIQHPRDTFYVRVNGDSMIDAGIFDGDLLVVDRAVAPRHSDVVIAQVGDGLTVKKFAQEKGQLRLVPSNSEFRPIEITEDTRICGVAKFAIHKL